MASNDPQPKRRGNVLAPVISAIVVLALAGAAAFYFWQRQAQPPAPPMPAVPAAPGTPGAQSPAAAAQPGFDVVRVDAQGNTVIAGHGQPGATITVLDGTNSLGTATADTQGAFVLIPGSPLAPGAHVITLQETLADGTKIAGAQSAAVNVQPGQTLSVLSGPNGSQVLSGQGPVPGVPGIGAVDYDAQGHAIFTGTAPANATVTLSLGGKLLGRTKTDSTGRWKLTADVPQQSGTLKLGVTTASGQQLPPVAAPFALETLKTALEAGHVVIAPGDNLWLIARRVYGHGTLYTLIYSANASQIHNPNLIFPGQAFALPKPDTN